MGPYDPPSTTPQAVNTSHKIYGATLSLYIYQRILGLLVVRPEYVYASMVLCVVVYVH